jgi:hypothetical protein
LVVSAGLALFFGPAGAEDASAPDAGPDGSSVVDDGAPDADLPDVARGESGDASASSPGRRLRLRYTFQPDCYRFSLSAPCETPKGNVRLDLGPQIAVWVETADRKQFIADLMVTNLTAVRGIGNRPGYWKFPSTWRFPYGKRVMALPVWAHARGRLYDTVVMQTTGGEMDIGFHEAISSPDPYHCLSFMSSVWVFRAESVDAITCPTSVFNSSKGRLDDKKKTRYPPRSDLVDFSERDCNVPWSGQEGQCPANMKSATRYADINDLDTVAAATPVYGKPFSAVWTVPDNLPEGDYALFVEISKEFDQNASHAYKSYVDPKLEDAALTNNFGQPSVVFKVPIRLSSSVAQQAAVVDIAGYGDWDGATGQLHPPDATISDAPGSGRGRLMVISQPSIDSASPRAVTGRVHVVTEIEMPKVCNPAAAGTGNITGLSVPADKITSSGVTIEFIEPATEDEPVETYEIKYRQGDSMTEEEFLGAIPAPAITPSGPGRQRTFSLQGLKPSTRYVVGIRAKGRCLGTGPIAPVAFMTPALKFKKLSGCFIATAAYGSPEEREIEVLRRLRDGARAKTAFAAAAVDLYERSSPPVADLLRESAIGRVMVLSLLAPLVDTLARVMPP